ncbi:MAG TPA: ligase-associated DNA damage response DEXH box helicase [Aestuariivirgaceae bacterium]
MFEQTAELPEPFARWFERRGWKPRAHQLAVLAKVQAGLNVLLIAPTGGGKTLAGFLPSLVDLVASGAGHGVHTLYVSPLKALAVDIARNLEKPVSEMGLGITVETRTGDTPAHKRRRQRSSPPDILIATPEQLALMIADPHAKVLFRNLRAIVLDELHALVASKRGALLSLGLARLNRLAPQARRIGLSATVARPDVLQAWLVPQRPDAPLAHGELVLGPSGPVPRISILKSVERVPWSGHSARYSIGEIYDVIKQARLALLFVNTRSQAEVIFQELWRVNDATLPIALHHGSLDVAQRRKVEAAMAGGRLRAVVSTSTLDLGIDWGDVDLVINIGAPKGSSRLIQRIGRSNHRLEEPSAAMLVPSNRFEVLECEAARMAVREGIQDSERMVVKKLDVLAQHILGMAVHAPFHPSELYQEVVASFAYRDLARHEFDQAVEFVATGGYALKTYERYARLKSLPDGRLRLAHPRLAQTYRLNVGTIVEDEMLKVRLVRPRQTGRPLAGYGGRLLGEVEEWFINSMAIGDTFIFAGEVVKLEAVEELTALVSRTKSSEPAVPSYYGGKFPLSTFLAARVREMLADPLKQQNLPVQVREWLSLQRYASVMPRADEMLVETFPRGNRHYLVCYPFEGRLAHQTLGMLLTRRLERWGAQPMGFVASEYALCVWMVRDANLLISSGRLSLARLFDEDMLGDDLDAWLAESMLMKRTFRTCAIIAGLIERRFLAKEKTGRQMTVSSDLIYDVLRSHEPDHILLRAAWEDAAEGLIDARRLAQLLARIKGKILHRALDRISPLSVPVMLEIGREPVYGEANDALLEETARSLIREASGSEPQ